MSANEIENLKKKTSEILNKYLEKIAQKMNNTSTVWFPNVLFNLLVHSNGKKLHGTTNKA